jgi:hypothetical protein
MTLKYGAVIGTSKSPISDSITRVYSFNILPTGSTPTSSATSSHKPSSNPTLQPGVLKPIP